VFLQKIIHTFYRQNRRKPVPEPTKKKKSAACEWFSCRESEVYKKETNASLLSALCD